MAFFNFCLNCGSDKTYIDKRGYNLWYHYKDGYLCSRCYNRLINNPTNNPKYHPRRLVYKDKRLFMKENPRTGICSICHMKVGEEYINCFGKIAIMKQTQMHHIQYHDDEPLKDTIELCVSCHRKEHIK